jgi:DnaJ-class molecular chaperone
VPREATAEEVKRAYRKLALQLHPDKNGGDATAAAAFQRVGFAYNVLSDPMKKRYYDETGARQSVAPDTRTRTRKRTLHRRCSARAELMPRMRVPQRCRLRPACRRHGGD